MSLTERTEIDKIEVVGNWNIQVRQATTIEKDGEQVARTFHRWVLTPDSDISNQDAKVQAVCNAVWTPEVVSDFEAYKEEQASRFA